MNLLLFDYCNHKESIYEESVIVLQHELNEIFEILENRPSQENTIKNIRLLKETLKYILEKNSIIFTVCNQYLSEHVLENNSEIINKILGYKNEIMKLLE
jgi:hypothetical protein